VFEKDYPSQSEVLRLAYIIRWQFFKRGLGGT
jgi:hypothetical protein